MQSNKLYLAAALVLFFGGLTLVACAGPVPRGAATAQPTAKPTATAAPTSTGQAIAQNAALQQAQQLLAKQIDVEPSAISTASVRSVDWPDDCLGVHLPDQLCAQHVVPGYRIVLEAKGRPFEYHTNQDGSIVVAVPDLVISWQAGNQCELATMRSYEGVASGACGGSLTTAAFVSPTQSEDLTTFVETYRPFDADTPAGTLHLFGMGNQVPTPAEQRMMAEWARITADEASGGRAGAAYGLAFAWHREGGVAGFCDDLAVYVTGEADATSCKGTQPQDLGRRRLAADQLQLLFTWVDTFQSFEIDQTTGATADQMTIRLVFDGTGTQTATEGDKQAILDFAAQLYAQFGQQQATPTPAAAGVPVQVTADSPERHIVSHVALPEPLLDLDTSLALLDSTRSASR